MMAVPFKAIAKAYVDYFFYKKRCEGTVPLIG